MSARDETSCFRCGGTFQTQHGYRVFWTGADGSHAFCSPQHALESVGEPERVTIKQSDIELWRRTVPFKQRS